ncbi:hypothetical protein [Leifsonia poae]|nr:hypothetical protein [Leifsonia poae]
MTAKPGLIPLGDANAVVCDGDVCVVPGADATPGSTATPTV